MNDMIEKKAYYNVAEDNDMVEVQEIKDEKDMAAARKYFMKMQLEGEKPTRFLAPNLFHRGGAIDLAMSLTDLLTH